MPARYVISYDERRDGWFASVYTVPGCHVEAETLGEARTSIIKALALFFDDVEPEQVVDGDIHWLSS